MVVFYPKDLAQRRELEYASRQFNLIELNGSFYSLQRPQNFAQSLRLGAIRWLAFEVRRVSGGPIWQPVFAEQKAQELNVPLGNWLTRIASAPAALSEDYAEDIGGVASLMHYRERLS